MNGIVQQILIAKNAGAELIPIQEAQFILGKGIEGDRYFNSMGTFSESLQEAKDFQVTLIEQEEIEAFNLATNLNYSPGDFRRNIVTKGIELNPLVGTEFSVGSVILKAVRLCEPCGYLAGLLDQKIMKHMVHKAGIRAIILVSGQARIGDSISKI